jgi:intraflagellar transport protein 57
LQLVLFLLKLCDQAFTVDKFDDVTSKTNKLILTLKSMGFALDYSASKLKLGYGEAACATLDFICDKALGARNFTWPRPSYPKEDFADEAEVDEDAEIDGADDTHGAGGGGPEDDEEELYSDIVRNGKSGDGSSPLEESYQQMIVSDVDPLLWKTELERVGPRLKVSAKEEDGKEWHTHIDRTRKHETAMKELLPRATTQLKLIGATLRETIERMGTKEKQLNHQYETLGLEYRALQEKLKTISDKCKDDSDRVNVMSNEHAAITEQLRDTKSVMDDRGSKMTDTTPLVAIKDALKTLSAEIKNFELRIGVVGHTLMQAKARQASSGMRRKGGGGGYQDPEYDQSDEDSS